MYPEFVPIYVMLVIVILMLCVVLIFLIKLMKNGAGKNNLYNVPRQSNDAYYGQQYQQQQYQAPYEPQYQQQSGNVVFCKHCATQFDASQAYCPRCGTRR